MSNTPVHLRNRHWDAAGILDTALNMTQDEVNARLMAAAGNDSADAHNAVYRGKSLGSSVTASQYAAIGAGTFEDLYIGDYWTIGGVKWRIAAFDYWLRSGDTECTAHHAVIVPDEALYTAQMHNTQSGEHTENPEDDVTAGAYVGSDMYTANLAQAKTVINSAFGSAHVLNHREHFANAVTDGFESGGAWYDSTVDLMNEFMVYGTRINNNGIYLGSGAQVGCIDKSQLPLFTLDHSRICNRVNWWLRDVADPTAFSFVTYRGQAYARVSDYNMGVRPAFGICAGQ